MAIQLFAFVFPLTPAKVQERRLGTGNDICCVGLAATGSGQKGRHQRQRGHCSKLSTLRVATKETKRSATGDVTNMAVEKLIEE